MTLEEEAAISPHLVGKYYTYTDVTDLQWADEGHTLLNCTVTFEDPTLGNLAYTATAEDITLHSPEIFARAVALEFGPIADYVPPSVETVRACMQPLAKWRFEAMIDIYGDANSIDLRGMIDAAVEALPQPDKTVVKSKRLNVSDVYRADPLFDFIGTAVGMSAEEIDDLWSQALSL